MDKEKTPRLCAKCDGNRSVITKLIKETETIIKVEQIDDERLKMIANSLSKKLELVNSLDKEIIDGCPVEEAEDEILESDEINTQMMETL